MSRNRLSRWLSQLEKFADRSWYLPLMAGLTALDFFILILPLDGMVMTSAFLRRPRWFATALGFALGAWVGGMALALAIDHWGEPLVRSLMGDVLGSPYWLKTAAWVGQHGIWALLGLTLTPLPLHPPIAICTLAGVPLVEMAGILFVGRLTKYSVLCWVSCRAPKFLTGKN
jgi:membrane protein YqaA with SNARE-associated domain